MKKNIHAQALGRKGGLKTKKRGKKFYQEIGAKGNKAQGKKSKV